MKFLITIPSTIFLLWFDQRTTADNRHASTDPRELSCEFEAGCGKQVGWRGRSRIRALSLGILCNWRIWGRRQFESNFCRLLSQQLLSGLLSSEIASRFFLSPFFLGVNWHYKGLFPSPPSFFCSDKYSSLKQ